MIYLFFVMLNLSISNIIFMSLRIA